MARMISGMTGLDLQMARYPFMALLLPEARAGGAPGEPGRGASPRPPRERPSPSGCWCSSLARPPLAARRAPPRGLVSCESRLAGLASRLAGLADRAAGHAAGMLHYSGLRRRPSLLLQARPRPGTRTRAMRAAGPAKPDPARPLPRCAGWCRLAPIRPAPGAPARPWGPHGRLTGARRFACRRASGAPARPAPPLPPPRCCHGRAAAPAAAGCREASQLLAAAEARGALTEAHRQLCGFPPQQL